MKKVVYIYLITLFGLTTFSAYSEPKDSVCLEISGKITGLNSSINKSYQVELIYDNKVIELKEIKDNKTFSFHLNKNCIYTIRISKKGFTSRIISVNTKLASDNNLLYLFEFETDLIRETESLTLDQESLEFPIAIIEFHKDSNWFYFNEEYTSNIKRSLYKTAMSSEKTQL